MPRFDNNKYSVTASAVGRPVEVYAYGDSIVIRQDGRIVAAQLAAAGGRPIRWYFAEPETEAFAKELFENAGGGRDRIETQVLPWPGSAP